MIKSAKTTSQHETPHSVLIVDDDKFLLDMYAMKFEEQKFKVSTAFNAQDALAKLSDPLLKPDILLLDIVMPGMDGFELLQELNKKNIAPNAARIILSNLGQKEDIDKGLSLGAQGYIVKASATPSEVVARVLDIVEKKKEE